MIYSRWGSPLTITAYCGKHKPKWASGELVLVQVRFDDGEQRYMHVIGMKADGGWAEVDAAVDAAPTVGLAPGLLKKALQEAE